MPFLGVRLTRPAFPSAVEPSPCITNAKPSAPLDRQWVCTPSMELQRSDGELSRNVKNVSNPCECGGTEALRLSKKTPEYVLRWTPSGMFIIEWSSAEGYEHSMYLPVFSVCSGTCIYAVLIRGTSFLMSHVVTAYNLALSNRLTPPRSNLPTFSHFRVHSPIPPFPHSHIRPFPHDTVPLTTSRQLIFFTYHIPTPRARLRHLRTSQ